MGAQSELERVAKIDAAIMALRRRLDDVQRYWRPIVDEFRMYFDDARADGAAAAMLREIRFIQHEIRVLEMEKPPFMVLREDGIYERRSSERAADQPL